MSKSLARVRRALEQAGMPADIVEIGPARTAQEAAQSLGCHIDQIAKSILFADPDGARLFLFLTAGGNRIDPAKAARLAGTPLARAEARQVRAATGFAIGGVAPLGHMAPLAAWFDPRLSDFARIWAAAGTPRHVFCLPPLQMQRASNAQVADFTSE